MNVGAILDYVAGELDAQVLAYMQEYAIPPSLMDKALDRIQSHMRQMKSEEYAQDLVNMQMNLAIQQQEKGQADSDPEEMPKEAPEPANETKEGTVDEFMEDVGMKGGGQCRHSAQEAKTEKPQK